MKKVKFGFLSAFAAIGLISVASCGNATVSTTSVNTTTTTTSSQSAEVKTIYASPTGVETATGTMADPLDVTKAMLSLNAGDTLILLEGKYTINERILLDDTHNGKSNAYITVKGQNNNVCLDFSNQTIADSCRGVQVNGNYWHFYGIDIMGAGDNGMYIAGSYNIVENCTFHDNQDTGLQLGRAASTLTNLKDWPHNNLIKNCTSYNNYDYKSYGENADGFAAKLTVGEANVFDGCIAYRNADDGWDLYAKSDSGVVGTTIIKNCLAFENGWLLEKCASPDESDFDSHGVSTITTTTMVKAKATNQAYTTRDGDGIGFKLGGSSMQGNVIVENCLSFNNRLHGFSDNSNPGILSLKNCTAYNNSVKPDSETGAVGPSDTTNKSNNFDLSRTENSYNNYYGLLSYTTNQTVEGASYSNSDAWTGSTGYSIFNIGKNKYTFYDGYQDATSYVSTKKGTAYVGMNDSIFASVTSGYTVDATIHQQLRNSDGSINTGSMLDVVDSTLLTFCEGNQIGSKTNLTSWDAYDHYDFSDFSALNLTNDEIAVRQAADALTLMCNPAAVYQNVNLLTVVNGCKVSWESSNEAVLYPGQLDVTGTKITTHTSTSGNTYIDGVVYRDRSSDTLVTLTATIKLNDATYTKDFIINVKKDNPQIGEIVGFEDRYILTQFSEYTLPNVSVTNASSYSGLTLIDGQDYTCTTEILYASSSSEFAKGNYYEISKVYTSLAGVYKVNYYVCSLLADQKTYTTSFYAYVVSEDADIDISVANDKPVLEVNASRDGVSVSASFTNILGIMYVYATADEITDRDEVMTKGKAFEITDESLTSVYEMPNDASYNVYVVVTNKSGTVVSDIYKKTIELQEISSPDDFHTLVSTSTSSTTIYLLTQNLDFTGYEWATHEQSFSGLFNGNGYTISNLTVEGTAKKDAAIFYKVKNGTIMNVNFENINIIGVAGTATIAGIVSQMAGGYIHNVSVKNITVSAHTAAGGVVGQIVGGTNYISQVSVINDEQNTITVTNKYCGGIVANIQQDSDQKYVKVTISNCYVNATIGDGKDSGGYVGGIVGRVKNEYSTYDVEINRCVYIGLVQTGKNYAAGIFAGTDNGAGNITIIRCVTNCQLYYAGTLIDGITAFATKNGSPIYGRYSVGEGVVNVTRNFASFDDYQSIVGSDSEDFYTMITEEYFWKNNVGLDLENIWTFDSTTGTISLNAPTANE